MKVRNGFVSNSSSSSFVLLVEKEAYFEKLLELDPLDQAIAEAVFSETTAFGKEFMLYDRAVGMGECYWFDSIDNDKIVERAEELAKKQDRLIVSEVDENYELSDIVAEGLYDIGYTFQIKGKYWTHKMDW